MGCCTRVVTNIYNNIKNNIIVLIEVQKRKCLRCGHTFSHTLGGIILDMAPKCTKCGSRITIKIKRLI